MILLNHPRRAEDTALHTDANPHCSDFECPCWNTLAEPGLRSDFDILSQFEEDDEEVSTGMGDGYLSFYDSRVPVDVPPLTCSGLYEFMLSTINPEQSDRWNKGWIAGMLMAMGESDPNFTWESAEPPESR